MHIFETQPDSMACSVPEILLGPEASHAVGQTATTEELQQQRALRIRLQDTPGYGERGCRGKLACPCALGAQALQRAAWRCLRTVLALLLRGLLLAGHVALPVAKHVPGCPRP